jgi:SAM-dependent methyltransferase
VIVKRVVSVFKAGGVSGVLSAAVRRLRMPRAHSFPEFAPFARDAIGIEIGGPSPIFARGGLLPVYPIVAGLDNCNFARRTIWEGAISEGASFEFDARKAPGKQYIAEGADLHMIPSGSYDFVLSSHMLEHTANPLRALTEWSRLLREGGALLLVVPHRDGTFDHRRPATMLSHLRDDFRREMGEEDLTHLPEILELHDAARDPGVHDVSFRERAERNAELRSLHHHVFDTRLVVDAVREVGLEVISVEPMRPYHVVVIARKAPPGAPARSVPETVLSEVLRRSPFPTDRQAS